MNNPYSEVRKTLNNLAGYPLFEIADMYLSQEKELGEYKKALENKALGGEKKSSLVTVSHAKLDRLLEKINKSNCPIGHCKNSDCGCDKCRTMLMRFLSNEDYESELEET